MSTSVADVRSASRQVRLHVSALRHASPEKHVRDGTWKLPANPDVKKAPRRIACVGLSRVEVNSRTSDRECGCGPWIQYPPALVALPPPLVFSNYITMSEHEYKFDVVMTCSGCSGAVERVLSKLQGVDSYDVSLESQSVVVRGSAPFDTVLEKIKKTGKEVKSSQVVR
ncbi:hypothetical protein PaG_01019 [Moesziomyces aphidis]|uniref:HMA domain-containing protein n=1 Tax=Moesziomyces aphidis TaxID=84754 RepID=W3VSL8_MOEAP|nr:hypothetical protein PaG_01019 [Moesziomyces aphidis]